MKNAKKCKKYKNYKNYIYNIHKIYINYIKDIFIIYKKATFWKFMSGLHGLPQDRCYLLGKTITGQNLPSTYHQDRLEWY